jgi:hypothetical protein
MLLVLIAFLILIYTSPEPRMSPDGQYYLQRPNVMPYVLRGLGSFRLFRFRDPLQVWGWINNYAIFATSLVLEKGHAGAGLLFLGLASTRTNVIFPVLTDQLGLMMLAFGYVFDMPIFYFWGGLFNEKVPLIGGLLNPLGFLGLIFPLYAKFKYQEPLDQRDPDWLRFPLRTGLLKLRTTPPQDYILPWGIAAIGLFFVPWYLIAVAYLPLLLVQDRARVYQWISPMVCIAAAQTISLPYLMPLIIIHFMNPWRQTI